MQMEGQCTFLKTRYASHRYYAIHIEHRSLPVTHEKVKSSHPPFDVTADVMAHDPHALANTFYIYPSYLFLLCPSVVTAVGCDWQEMLSMIETCESYLSPLCTYITSECLPADHSDQAHLVC